MQIVNTALTLKDLPPPPPGKSGWPWTEENQPLPARMSDGSEWPRISIVTPSYNYGHFIEETIRSVLLQGYPNLEYIVIDGGSTDNSVEIIQKYEKYLSYWISQPDAGQTDAINKGYSKCTGDVFVWLNSDDSYINFNSLKAVAEAYVLGYKLIAGQCLNVYDDGTEIVINPIPISFVRYLKFWLHPGLSAFPQASVFVAKEITDKCFPLDKDLSLLMDYQMFLRVLSHRPKSIYINQIWTRIKYHGQNKTSLNNDLTEIYQVFYSESKKLSFVSRKLLEIDAEDFRVIDGLMQNKLNLTKDALTALISRPSIARWPRLWKMLIKFWLGKL